MPDPGLVRLLRATVAHPPPPAPVVVDLLGQGHQTDVVDIRAPDRDRQHGGTTVTEVTIEAEKLDPRRLALGLKYRMRTKSLLRRLSAGSRNMVEGLKTRCEIGSGTIPSLPAYLTNRSVFQLNSIDAGSLGLSCLLSTS